MEQGKWESVRFEVGDRCELGDGVVVYLMGCSGGMREYKNLYKWKILFSLNIAFRLLICRRGAARLGMKTSKPDGFI